jgi:hypothetical protein
LTNWLGDLHHPGNACRSRNAVDGANNAAGRLPDFRECLLADHPLGMQIRYDLGCWQVLLSTTWQMLCRVACQVVLCFPF